MMIDDTKQAQLDAVASLDIGQLRRAAKTLGINAEKTWTKVDFIEAIQNKQKSTDAVNAVFDLNIGPAPGHARVIIHRDPTPNHANSPVHVSVNGRIIAIPRGSEFDIPIPHVEALQNATSIVTESSSGESRENPGGVYKENSRMSYPFQVLAITPGPYYNNSDGRAAKAKKKQDFFDKFGSWPTSGELTEYERASINKRINLE